MLFKFDNPIGSWTRSVWWRSSQPQEIKTILLGSLPPEKDLNMSSMSYHRGLVCIVWGGKPIVFNPILRRSFVKLPPPPQPGLTLTRRLAFLGSTSTVFKVLSVAEHFGGYILNLITVGQGGKESWQTVKYDLSRHSDHIPASEARSVCIDSCVYYQAYLRDSKEAVLVKVEIHAGVLSIIKLPEELTVNLAMMLGKPSGSPFSWYSTVLGVHRGKLSIGINSRLQSSTVVFSMESLNSWAKKTIFTDKFEEGLDMYVQTYLRGFSSCGENIIFTMHDVIMEGDGFENRHLRGARVHVVYYNSVTGNFDREAIEAVHFPPSEATGSDTVVWDYSESKLWLKETLPEE